MALPSLRPGVRSDAPLCACGKHRPLPPATLCKSCRLQSANAPPCRHCRQHPSTRPRGLCSTCFNDPDIRSRYRPQRNREPDHGVPDRTPRRKRPLWPTQARPGSNEKQGVLACRAEMGWPLWHPDDERSELSRRARKRALRLLAGGKAVKA